jgi:hypothetical protein
VYVLHTVIIYVYEAFYISYQEATKFVQIGASKYDGGNWEEARQLFTQLATAPELADFLTLPAYESIIKKDTVQANM